MTTCHKLSEIKKIHKPTDILIAELKVILYMHTETGNKYYFSTMTVPCHLELTETYIRWLLSLEGPTKYTVITNEITDYFLHNDILGYKLTKCDANQIPQPNNGTYALAQCAMISAIHVIDMDPLRDCQGYKIPIIGKSKDNTKICDICAAADTSDAETITQTLNFINSVETDPIFNDENNEPFLKIINQ